VRGCEHSVSVASNSKGWVRVNLLAERASATKQFRCACEGCESQMTVPQSSARLGVGRRRVGHVER
jgi:hypothetical protein